MNIFKTLITALAIGLASLCASAQNFDLYYSNVRTVQVGNPVLQQTAAVGAGAGLLTNPPVDFHGGIGIATVDLGMLTNASGQIWTATPQISSDLTNWIIPPYAVSVAYQAISTNLYWSTNELATNNFLLPTALTVPNAPLAGWSYPPGYLGGNPYTNTGAASLTMKGDTMLGIPMQSGSAASRYLQIIWNETATGASAATNAYLSAPVFKFTYNQ